jgi:hypothetical protein
LVILVNPHRDKGTIRRSCLQRFNQIDVGKQTTL